MLAAGAGRRMGAPKALLRTAEGETWAARAARALGEGGCDRVVVTTGARAAEVRAGLPPLAGRAPVDAVPVVAWTSGMGASLRAGISAAWRLELGLDVLVVTLVDLPDVDAAVVTSLLAAVPPRSHEAVVRAVWDGRAGHPVLLGRDLLPAAHAEARGDEGARELLTRCAGTVLVEQSRRAGSGGDVDLPADLPPGTRWPGGPGPLPWDDRAGTAC
ncbi:nucleotidyltransferase family protein [Kineococcus glutinatus]|uniref:Nucleotidyltransferase family protein n=1 Tax=Kineococcus glutinatus TaxID=1070872 RepID=A0ABP8VJI7_9ACTN